MKYFELEKLWSFLDPHQGSALDPMGPHSTPQMPTCFSKTTMPKFCLDTLLTAKFYFVFISPRLQRYFHIILWFNFSKKLWLHFAGSGSGRKIILSGTSICLLFLVYRIYFIAKAFANFSCSYIDLSLICKDLFQKILKCHIKCFASLRYFRNLQY